MSTILTVSVRFTRLRLNTNVVLQVAEKGVAGQEPVLFLHGFTDSWFSFASVLDRLPAGIHAIAPSQRGHGDSERPPCGYRVADFAADAVALLDAFGIERATVVGHSMGSFVAQRVAIEHSNRIKRLVLIGSGTTARTAAVLDLNEAVQKLTDPVPPSFIREFQESTVFRSVPPAFMKTVVSESEKVPARVWRETLSGLVDPAAQLQPGRILASTMIIWGDREQIWPQAQQDGLARAISGSRLITYRGCGHTPHWEDPARVVEDLLAFVGVPYAPADRRDQ